MHRPHYHNIATVLHTPTELLQGLVRFCRHTVEGGGPILRRPGRWPRAFVSETFVRKFYLTPHGSFFSNPKRDMFPARRWTCTGHAWPSKESVGWCKANHHAMRSFFSGYDSSTVLLFVACGIILFTFFSAVRHRIADNQWHPPHPTKEICFCVVREKKRQHERHRALF